MKKENKKYFVAAALAIASIIVIFIVVIVQKINSQKRFDEQMDLGNRYLSEENYEAAVVAFNKAIEIDPRNAEAYSKAAQAYAGMGDYEGAIQVLEKGIANTGDAGLKQERDNYERYYNLLPVFQKLSSCFRQEDRTMVWEYMSGDEYQNATIDLEQRLEYPDGNGKYLFVYPCGHAYYGDVEAGQRSGYGMWADCEYKHTEVDDPWLSYTYDGFSGHFYQGEWKENYPNGEGIDYDTVITDADNEVVSVQGIFKDGYEDGNMTIINSNFPEDIAHYRCNNGIPEVLRWDGEGEYIYADGAGGSWSVLEGIKMGVSHACKDKDTSMNSRTARTDSSTIQEPADSMKDSGNRQGDSEREEETAAEIQSADLSGHYYGTYLYNDRNKNDIPESGEEIQEIEGEYIIQVQDEHTLSLLQVGEGDGESIELTEMNGGYYAYRADDMIYTTFYFNGDEMYQFEWKINGELLTYQLGEGERSIAVFRKR